MKGIQKFLNFLSSISSIMMIISIYLFLVLTKNFYLNGYVVLIFLCMLLNPIQNLLRFKKKIITNPFYHLLVTGVSAYTSYIAIHSIFIYYQYFSGKDNTEAINRSIDYFGNYFIYIGIAILGVFLLSFLFHKKVVEKKKDKTNLFLFIIFVTALFPIVSRSTSNMGMLPKVSNLVELIFVVILFFQSKNIAITRELQKYYFVLMALSLLSLNPIAFVLSIHSFLQLDTFGVHL